MHLKIFPVPSISTRILIPNLIFNRKQMAIEIDQLSQRLAEAEAKVKTEVARIKKKMQVQITELEMSLDVANKQNIDMQKTIKIQSTKITVGVLHKRFHLNSFVAFCVFVWIKSSNVFLIHYHWTIFFFKVNYSRCLLSKSWSMSIVKFIISDRADFMYHLIRISKESGSMDINICFYIFYWNPMIIEHISFKCCTQAQYI